MPIDNKENEMKIKDIIIIDDVKYVLICTTKSNRISDRIEYKYYNAIFPMKVCKSVALINNKHIIEIECDYKKGD